MIKLLKVNIFFISLFASVLNLSAQGTFYVSIKIPASMQSQSFRITLNDGLNELPITDIFIQNRLNFSGKFFSKAAVVTIHHVGADSISHNDSYFINTKPAKIIFADNATMQTDGDFKYVTLVNANEIYQSKIKKQRNTFLKTELDEMRRFCDENAGDMFKKDSLTKLFYKKLRDINAKDIEFIKKNGNEYFSFWLFKTQILSSTLRDASATRMDFESLLTIYNMVFPSTFKSTAEGKKIREQLTGRINTRINYEAPNFEMKDINGNLIKLSDFNGKYILIDFWGTWCPPCMRQIPFIKKIRDEYPEDQLAIISISTDVEYKRFKTVVEEKGMNWIHVYDSKDLPAKFGVSAYPTIFLINKKGVIIFDGKGKDNDALETLLKQM